MGGGVNRADVYARVRFYTVRSAMKAAAMAAEGQLRVSNVVVRVRPAWVAPHDSRPLEEHSLSTLSRHVLAEALHQVRPATKVNMQEPGVRVLPLHKCIDLLNQIVGFNGWRTRIDKVWAGGPGPGAGKCGLCF